uniref:Uncharacterized protein n=1 Tax=Arion vulgaris TaxID=1028688 RepID=A0A0B6ZE23_9EUPU
MNAELVDVSSILHDVLVMQKSCDELTRLVSKSLIIEVLDKDRLDQLQLVSNSMLNDDTSILYL